MAGHGSAGHGATPAATGHPVQQTHLSGRGSHVGGTQKGGPVVANGAVSTFRPASMSSAQVGVIRQNIPIPAPVYGMRNARPTGASIRRGYTSTPRV